MAQYKITLDEKNVQGLFAGEGLKKLVEDVVNQVLQAQVTEQLGAQPYERTEERKGYRSGSRDRPLKTRVGRLKLRVPRARGVGFETEMFERMQRSEQALVLALMEMVVNGVSTRKVTRVVEEMCGLQFSKSTVSDLCRGLDPLVREWNCRDLSGQEYPFLIVDAMFVKVRRDRRVRMSSLLIATGVNREGYREVLGLKVEDGETQSGWGNMFGWLKERGLRGVDIVVSDNHKGLVRAIEEHFTGASWQRCQTHLMRNILDACPKSLWPELHPRIRMIFEAPDMGTARKLLQETLQEYEGRAPKAISALEDGFDDAMAVMALPARYRKRLRTSNSIERLNQEIRRRERVIRIFPNEESAYRLMGALLMEIDEAWSTGKKYFDMEDYWTLRRLQEGKTVELRKQVA